MLKVNSRNTRTRCEICSKLTTKIPERRQWRGFAKDCLEMYENRADHLSNNLKLNQISMLIFFQFYCKTNRNQLKIVLESLYGVQVNKYFEILKIKIMEQT